ncbi:F0F1 ATP synthase subunit A [bacterium]|nr:F0F1 ATP synthase subunit A [bacterium]
MFNTFLAEEESVLNFYMGTDFSPSMKTSIIIFVFLAILFIGLGIAFSKMDPDKDEVPTKGLKFLAVMLVDTINNFVEKNINKDTRKLYAPYFIGIASFISLANVASLFGLNPPFANLGVAIMLSILAFVTFQFTGLKFQGIKKRIKGFVGPVPMASFLVFPISVIGEFTTPFAMGVRMFGNIFSGVVLAGLVFAVTDMLGAMIGTVIGEIIGSFIATVVVTAILHPIFDIFFGLLQMYVYFMLTTMFIKQNMN